MKEKIPKKRIITIGACVLILICVCWSAYVTYIPSKGIVKRYFCDTENAKWKNIYEKSGQSVTVEDYKITLENVLYNNKTSLGCCKFSIFKKDGVAKMETNKWGEVVNDLIDSRFKIDINGSRDVQCEVLENTLYVYMSFSIQQDLASEVECKLIDYSQIDKMDNEGYKSYKFNIKESEKINEYRINEYISMAISPIGIAIDSERSLFQNKIVFFYKNGKSEVIVDTENDIGTGGSGESNINGSVRYHYVFSQLKNIDEIYYIKYNNKRYNKEKNNIRTK